MNTTSSEASRPMTGIYIAVIVVEVVIIIALWAIGRMFS